MEALRAGRGQHPGVVTRLDAAATYGADGHHREGGVVLKLMTLNINGNGDKHGPWAMRRGLISAAIAQHAPDVVLLQAVRRARGRLDQASELARDTGFPYMFYEPGQRDADGNEDGSAILSQQPLTGVAMLPFEAPAGAPDPTRRVALRARWNANGDSVDVVNAHLSWAAEQSAQNAAQLLAWLDGARCIVAGDLNTPPDGAAMDAFRRARWTDAWSVLRGSDGGFTYEADRPSMRIDYVWASPGPSARPLALELVAAAPAAGARLSDHLGLVATLDTGGSRGTA
jgi:endonuclease/exonuclease/phosphatase family metal-dependent hydrolase